MCIRRDVCHALTRQGQAAVSSVEGAVHVAVSGTDGARDCDSRFHVFTCRILGERFATRFHVTLGIFFLGKYLSMSAPLLFA